MSPYLPLILLLANVGAACAVPGVVLLLRRVALVSDATSHVLLFGIVVAYLVLNDRTSPLLVLLVHKELKLSTFDPELPAATAYLLTDRLSWLLVLSVAFAVGGAVAGTLLAVLIGANVAGTLAVVLGAVFGGWSSSSLRGGG